MGLRSVTAHGNFGGGGGRKSTAEHVRDGTYKPSRHGGRGRAGTRKVIPIPDPPADAPALFKTTWRETAAVLDPLKIVTEADLAAFTLLVQALTVCADAFARIYKGARPGLNALVYEKPFKDGVQRTATPEVGILIQAQKLAAFHLSRFGMSPADRARVDAPTADGSPAANGADPLAEFDS